MFDGKGLIVLANKKKRILKYIILYGVSALIGIAIGVGGIATDFFNDLTVIDITIFMISFVVWFLVGIVVHELGHLVCGWASGYTFGFFKLGSLSWFKEGNQIKFKRSKNFAPGQCIMIPNEEEAEFKFLLYNLGGVMFNFLAGLAILLLWYILPSGHLLRNFAAAGIGLNLLLGVTNLVPLPSQANDGANIFAALKSPDGKRGFYLLLLMNGQLLKGKPMKEMDETIVRMYGKLDAKNHLVGNALLFEINYLLSTQQAEIALEIAEEVNTDKYPTILKHLFNFSKLVIYVSYLPDFEKAKAIYEEKDFQNFLKMKLPNVVVVLPAYEFFVNNNHEKAKELLVQAKEIVANVPSKGERLGLMDYLEQLESEMKPKEEQ